MTTGAELQDWTRKLNEIRDPRTGKLREGYLAERRRQALERKLRNTPDSLPLKEPWWRDPDTGWWYARDAFDRELSRPPGEGPGEGQGDARAAQLAERRAAFEARLAQAGFRTPLPDPMTLPEAMARELVAVTEAPCNVLYTGPAGVGKTTLLLLAAAHCHAQGMGVRCARMRDLKRALEGTGAAEEAEVLDAYLLPQVLLLDDLGAGTAFRDRASAHEVEVLHALHNRRDNAGRVTWFTTNLDVGGLRALYGDPLISRLTDRRNVLLRDFTGQRNWRWDSGGT